MAIDQVHAAISNLELCRRFDTSERQDGVIRLSAEKSKRRRRMVPLFRLK